MSQLKHIRVACVLVLCNLALSVSAMEGAQAIARLLNLRPAGSDKTYAQAAEIVRREAAAGGALQQYVLALVSAAPNAPDEIALDEDTRKKYLEKNRLRVRRLAETRNNAMAWYLLSMETDDLDLLKRAKDGGNVQALNAWGTFQLSRALSPGPLASTNEIAHAFAEAIDCFKKASLKKDPNSLCNLGMCYMRGYGVERNPVLSFGAFRAAADMGHTEAMNNLGGFYRDGIGTEVDAVIAARWFARSAQLGNSYGQLNYALALLNGEGESRDEKKALEYLRLSAAQKNPAALKCLADCYENGKGVRVDSKRALVFLMLSRAFEGDAPSGQWLIDTGHTNFLEEVTHE